MFFHVIDVGIYSTVGISFKVQDIQLYYIVANNITLLVENMYTHFVEL